MNKRIEELYASYPSLTAIERTELLLAAQERRDLKEIYVLDRTCRIADIEPYVMRLMLLERAASLLVIQLLAREVLLIKKFEQLAAGTAAPPPPDPDLLSMLERQAAMWRGFAAWCQDIGHDPRQVLLMAPLAVDDSDPASFIIHQQIERFEKWSEGSDPLLDDPDQVQMWRVFFADMFNP